MPSIPSRFPHLQRHTPKEPLYNIDTSYAPCRIDSLLLSLLLLLLVLLLLVLLLLSQTLQHFRRGQRLNLFLLFCIFSAEVDEEGLFREVKTLSFCCQLPSEKGVAEETVPSATTQQATDCPDAPTAAGETEADVPPETGAAATASATAAETGVCKEMSVVVTLGPRVFARDFGDLRDGGAYMLELQAVACPEQQQQQQELQLLRQQVGDKWRRLAVEVEPLSHIEAQKAVLQMRKGAHTQQDSSLTRHYLHA